MQDLFSLQGKVALVTGAAQGIGREMAIGFAQYGADIVAVDLNDERLQTLVVDIDGNDVRAVLGEPEGDFPADPLRGARDEGNFPL